MDNTELIRALRSAAATTGLDAYVELMQKAADALDLRQGEAVPADHVEDSLGMASTTRPMTLPQIEAMTNNMGIYDGDYETAIVRAVERHHEIKGATQ